MEGFIKYASWGDPIQLYGVENNTKVDKSKCGKQIFGSKSDFSKKYSACIDQYITATEQAKYKQDKFHRIGSYDPEFHYYRVISVHGDKMNDNGDLFRWGSVEDSEEPELLRFEPALAKYVYQTFVGRGNFKNHKNDDVSLAVGINLDVVANHEGKFIENLLAVDEKKDPELVRAIDRGYISSVSMGSRVGWSLCSYCGNKATSENFYCDHVKYHKASKLYKQGEGMIDVYEDNRNVNFIELSWVTVPADRDAKLLEKIASNMKNDTVDTVATLIYLFGEQKTRNLLNSINNKI